MCLWRSSRSTLTFAPATSSAQTVAAAPKSDTRRRRRAPRRRQTTAKKKARTRHRPHARAARSWRAPAPTLRARELKELQTPRFRVDEFGREVPDVRAEAAIIYNPETGEVLWENHSKDQRSMASITKVMTALVFLESNTPLIDRSSPCSAATCAHASTTYLRTGFKLPAEDLLNLLLVGSDNAAARALARSSNLGYDAFIQRMNEKAKELGLESTVYADPSGLLAENMSSAYDLARLIAYAAADERIGAIMRKTLVHHARRHARRSPRTAPIRSFAAATSTSSAARPASSAARVIAWRRCCACRSQASRSRSSCSARRPTPAASGKRVTSSTG